MDLTSPTSHCNAKGTLAMSLGVTKSSPASLSSVNTGRNVIGDVMKQDVARGVSQERGTLTSTAENMLLKSKKCKEFL